MHVLFIFLRENHNYYYEKEMLKRALYLLTKSGECPYI